MTVADLQTWVPRYQLQEGSQQNRCIRAPTGRMPDRLVHQAPARRLPPRFTRRRRKACESLAWLSKTFEESGTFIADHLKQQVLDETHRLFINHAWLSRDALSNGRLEWNQVPKMHWALHLADTAQYINPKAVRCYGEESFLGAVTRIYGRSVSGPWKAGVQGTVLDKFVLGLELAAAQYASQPA